MRRAREPGRKRQRQAGSQAAAPIARSRFPTDAVRLGYVTPEPVAAASHPFEQLDFVYWPSRDVGADIAWFERILGAEVIFAIDGMGTRVAMVELTDGAPRILLAGHLGGEAPILVYRVPDLTAAMADLAARGWEEGTTLEIPHGPVCSFTAPGGQRLAIYELKRPFMDQQFAGRRDF